jgi:SAM-dependent methyltransferase
MGWQQAGEAWGSRALDWAYLFEPYARAANDDVFDQVGVGRGVRLLDVACGSGYAAMIAEQRGVQVSGLDAAARLVEIARRRTPGGDFRVGDMFSLPFQDVVFDAVTSFNGIWAGCDAALVEAVRVLRPGGRLGMTFWGSPKRLGLLPYFTALASMSPTAHTAALVGQSDTGRPGVAEAMFATAGLTVVRRGASRVVNEWPDAELAVRALAAAGPSWPALHELGFEGFRSAMLPVVAALADADGSVRIVSEFGWLIGERASP